MSDALLPPIAWLRQSGWGRDLNAYAKGEHRTPADESLVKAFIDVTNDPVKALVSVARYRRALGSINYETMTAMKRLPEETLNPLLFANVGEHIIAYSLVAFIEDGSHIYSIGPELVAQTEADETLDLSVGDILAQKHSFYVQFQGTTALALDGSPLDGFLFVAQRDDEDDDPYFVPISKNTDVDQHIWCSNQVILNLEGSSLSEMIETHAGEFRSLAEEIDKHLDKPVTRSRQVWKKDEISDESVQKASRRERDDLLAQEIRTHEQAPLWTRLLTTALKCIAGNGPAGLAQYQPEAPQDLVQRATARGTGARKAQQKLNGAGFPLITYFELGNQAPEKPAHEAPQPNEASPALEDKPLAPVATSAESPRPEIIPGRRRRRLERMAKQAERVPVEASAKLDPSPDVTPESPVEIAPAITIPEPLVAVTPSGPPQHDPELIDTVDDVTWQCFKDLPSIDARNWESTFPPALASMIMRRAKVEQLPRETSDGTRRRLASDLLPRLENLPEIKRRLAAEQKANPKHRRSYKITSISVARDIDDLVVDAAAHPVHVIVEDDAFTSFLLFPGVKQQQLYDQPTTTVVTAWKEESTLHLIGTVHDGCLIGFRRVEYDLDDHEITTFESDADQSNAETILDTLYAPIADAVLGPVDELDAWRYEHRRSRLRASPALQVTPRNIIEIDGAEPSPEQADISTPELNWQPDPIDFESWEGLSRGTPALGQDAYQAIEAIMGRNTVARAALRAVEGLSDQSTSPIHAAAMRHLWSLANSSNSRVDALNSPNIRDEADLMAADDIDGVLVIADRALYEHASPGILGALQTMRETPLCVIYRLRRDGLSALLIQADSSNRLNLVQWARLPVKPSPEDSDLDWYLRGAVAEILLPQAVEPKPAKADILPSLPSPPTASIPRKSEDHYGPRRTVAQARIRPQNMQIAIKIATEWFDAQAQRHGPRLIEHRRNNGEWLIEHESEDRYNPSKWSVTLRLAGNDPSSLDIIVQTTLAAGVKPRLPTLVRDIAAATPTEGPDGILQVNPRTVASRSDLNILLRELQSPDRVLPILLMSKDRFGEFLRDPAEIARQSLGAITIWLIEPAMTYEMTDALGQEYRTFGGAVRLFQPRFDPDNDQATRHPRIMLDSGAERSLSDLIARATSATVTRYHIPEVLPQPREPVRDVPTAEPKPSFLTPGIARPAPLLPPHVAKAPAPAPIAPAPLSPKPVAPTIDPAAIERMVNELVERRLAERLTEQPASEIVSTTNVDEPELSDAQAEPELDLDDEPTPESASTDPVTEPTLPPATPALAPSTQALPADIDQKVEAAVVRQFQSLQIGDLIGAVSALVGRLDTAIGSGSAFFAGGESAGLRAEIAAKDEIIAAVREEVRMERDTAAELLTEAEAAREAATQEVAILRQALNERRRETLRGEADNVIWPKDLSGLSEWLETNVLPNVVITNKAWRAMRKVPFTDMERLCKTLQLLDGAYIDMRAGEDGGRQRWEDGLKELRLSNKKQSDIGKGIRGGNEYSFEHGGRRWDMDFHLRGNESLHNDHERLIRIYYTYDKEEGRVLIGHMPTHLTTIDS